MERWRRLTATLDWRAILILGVAWVDSGRLNIFIASLFGFVTVLMLIFPTAAPIAHLLGVVFFDALCFFFDSVRIIK